MRGETAVDGPAGFLRQRRARPGATTLPALIVHEEVLIVSTVLCRVLRAALLVLLWVTFSMPSLARAAAAWKVGDRVEAWNSSWFPVTILEIGSGSHAGQFKVRYDGFSSASDQWMKESKIRATQVAPSTIGIRPRAGRYVVLSYGSANPLRLGYFDLMAGDRYRFFTNGGRSIGEGTYTFDAKTSTLQWRVGPFQESGWSGGFSVERDGKTHKIRLNRTTFGSNSTDS